MSTMSSASGGRPMSVLERARALEAKCGGAKPAAAAAGVSKATSRNSSSTFVPSRIGNTAEAGSDGAPQSHSATTASMEAPKSPPRTSRYASIARLLDDADSSTVKQKPAQDVTEWPSSAPANKIPSSSSIIHKPNTTTKLSLGAKIASDKSKNTKNSSGKRHSTASSSSSGKNKLNSSANTTPAFLSRAVASWNKTEKYFDPLDSDPSSSSDSNGCDNGDDYSDDDASECSAASTNCTGSTHTSVTNSFTAASSVTSTTTGGDTIGNSSEGANGFNKNHASTNDDGQHESSESEDDDDELSGYSGAMLVSSRGSRVGISTRPVSIDSPPQVIRSKMPGRHRSFGDSVTSTGNDLNFHGYQSSDDETAIHDNTTAGKRTRSISSSADNSATTIDEDSTCSLFPQISVASKSVVTSSSSSSATSSASIDSTKATVTRQPADQTIITRVVTPDDKTSTAALSTLPPLNEDDGAIKMKPLWQCRLEDMRLRQKLMKELTHREQQDADLKSSTPRRTELPAKMHRQVVAGEEDWSKDFADDAFVAFDDDIFGRSEI